MVKKKRMPIVNFRLLLLIQTNAATKSPRAENANDMDWLKHIFVFVGKKVSLNVV